jgi:5'-methylthioadenosine phosphorylase
VIEERARLGIIGGSGLYRMEGLEAVREQRVETPFGEPSDPLRLGRLEGHPVAFLARHGQGHRLLPTEINFRANIWALKSLGVERILSVSAVGSLREDVHPGELLLPDQFLDRTRHRAETFFGRGLVAHVSMADPVCPELLDLVHEAAGRTGAAVHRGGTYVCMEGPQFSTRAESRAYRAWEASVIGMTNLQEARLSREAEICYLTLALVTDYDSWRDDGNDVDVGDILENLRRGTRAAAALIRESLRAWPASRGCRCGQALEGALLTDPSVVPAKTRHDLDLLLRDRLGEPWEKEESK